MSALSAFEATAFEQSQFEEGSFEPAACAATPSESTRRAALRRQRFQVVTAASRPGQPPYGLPRRPASRVQPGPMPLRLTRRGRIVASALAVVLAAVALTIMSMAAPGGAQAANHGRAGAGYQGMRQIVVQPGQTLWSIATKVEPSADPRLVVSQIMTANSLSSTAVQAGEELWVPK
jgi:LysM domain